MPAAPQPVTLDDGCPECVPARGRGASGEISHEIWRRTIPSEGRRPWLELGAAVQGRTLSAYIAEMCGRFTRNYTWEQIQAIYRLTAPAAIPNLQPRFNACPTDPADTIVERESKRELVEMRWGLSFIPPSRVLKMKPGELCEWVASIQSEGYPCWNADLTCIPFLVMSPLQSIRY
jgi:hypothetical protein